ncbi:alpha/beta hydrolase fold domain-containing protein [Pseudotabrizicola alkalilacus]|uniref:Esterase n=1 Tax=Pseudotabrizicola alkalilacus TaxID=2305252 RepID=A0A411Z670_9RHOB|nr:alpha/beta hydrolase [Pseudotabrizicola alkalilacus]RGP38544.1 esterase [Pseudotabrizicola alkalilacus]
MHPPHYQSLIDPATWAFIRATEAAYPPDTASQSIAGQRAVYDAMCRSFHAGTPPGVTAQDETVAGVPCRRYPGRNPVVIYFHGGGFVVGGLHSHDDVCAEIRAATGLTVLAVDYRLCPEHPHPAAYDDCLAVARATPGPILLAGDSAGGALAAAVAATLRDPRLLGQVLIYPGLGGHGASHQRHANAPMLTAEDVAFYARIRGAAPDDPTANPLAATDFTGLPPTLTLAAECDPLADDAADYAARIIAAGGRAQTVTEPGLVHGYLRARHTVPRARASFARITSTLAAFAQRRWPFGDMP